MSPRRQGRTPLCLYPLMTSVRQIAKVGTPAQLATAKSLLAETRRGLYRILAEDPEPEVGADTPAT